MNLQEIPATQSVEQFIQAHKITMTADPIVSNPNMDDSPEMTRHFCCKLRMGRKRLTIPFSQGSAHTVDPVAADVLDCLASDASGIGDSFEDWAAEYGYDADSRKAEKTYRACIRQSDKLLKFLGLEAYEDLRFNTERQ